MEIDSFWRQKEKNKMLELGCITNILSQNPFYKNKDLGYISSWLFNALDHNQIHIKFHSGLPVLFFSWAYLSESVAARYLYYKYVLDWSEWYEGELIWIIDLCSIISLPQEDIISTLCSCFSGKKYIYWNSIIGYTHKIYRLDIINRKISSKNRDEFIETFRY
ncbi:toxin-activating lysine-acyltransferase [Klebsiella aerogenes]|uniref:toxin-activating lysine-acyltransferase n=1 Tax=Klebsiella aerogenes TaxID=548 RepID=UPI00063C2352|nr:toxin-activating lysine-acyltransferase [Klebsiella aerogenes]EMB4081169.1 toxin-activating lysine-acyltransferase [Klebsiella aerogenes]KLF52478.1 hypothetical protein YA35_15820 [Klebsiella aerogenes]